MKNGRKILIVMVTILILFSLMPLGQSIAISDSNQENTDACANVITTTHSKKSEPAEETESGKLVDEKSGITNNSDVESNSSDETDSPSLRAYNFLSGRLLERFAKKWQCFRFLKIWAPAEIKENNPFQSMVTSNDTPVANAKVTVRWDNTTYYTNMNGTVMLTAPFVNKTTNYIIVAKKLGYMPSRTVITVQNQPPLPRTIYVDDNNTEGPWNGTMEHPYQHIQDGIDAANPGDTVFVYSGTYTERVAVTANLIKIIGQDRDTTIIQEPDDGGSNFVIHMTGKEDVTIDSFWIRSTVLPETDAMGIRASYSNNIDIINCNVTECGEGIQLYNSSDCRIMKCIAYNNHYTATDAIGNGISLDKESHNNLIMDCICYDNYANSLGDGVDLNPESSGNTIINCTTYDNQDDGISIDSDDNIIMNCTSYDNGGAGIFLVNNINNAIINCICNENGYGIYMHKSDNTNITNTNLGNNNVDGIYLGFSYDNTIYKNSIANNEGRGIRMKSSRHNEIFANFITNNSQEGILAGILARYNYFHHNNFINNIQNAVDNGINIWYNPLNSQGNYWDDYNGTDSNGDGIGDTPYNIFPYPYLNKDEYPYMDPIDIENITNDLSLTNATMLTCKASQIHSQFV